MAESFIQLNNDGPGKKIDTFTESTNGQHRQAMVVSDPSVTGGTATVDPVNGLSVAPKTLPPNAAQETGGNLAAIKADLDTIKTNTTQLATTQPVSLTGTTAVSGTVTAVQPTGANLHVVVDTAPTTAITATSLPLPSGAATSANQTSEITQLTTIANNTPPTGQAVMAASSPVVIASNQSAVPVTLSSTTISGNVNIVGTTTDGSTTETPFLVIGGESSDATAQYQPLPLSNGGAAVKVDGTATTQPISGSVSVSNFPATQPVSGTVTANQGAANATPWNENISQVGGSAVSTAATGVIKTGISGSAAATLDAVITVATAPTNGLAVLAVNNTTPPSLTTGQSVALQSDYAGSLFVKNYRRSQTASKATTIAATTTATTVLAAQGTGIFADLATLIVTVIPAATTSTAFTITLSDGTNSYIYDLTQGLATAAGEAQLNFNFNPPLPAASTNTAWTIANSTTTPTIHVTAVAVLQKAS